MSPGGLPPPSWDQSRSSRVKLISHGTQPERVDEGAYNKTENVAEFDFQDSVTLLSR